MKTALVLSGGGARGGAHIGVLKAIEELKINIDMIVGVSIGSAVGARYALWKNARKLERAAYYAYEKSRKPKLNLRKIISGDMSETAVKLGCWYANTFKAILPSRIFFKIFEKGFKDATFDDTKIEFHAIATDIRTGETVVLSKGKIIKAIEASMAIPGIFNPVEIDGRILVDGGTTNNLPVDIAKKLGADRVIAVDLSNRKITKPSKTGNSYLVFIDHVRDILMHEDRAKMADVYLNPPVQDIDTLDFSKTLKIVSVGYEYAKEKLSKLQEKGS